MVKINFNEISIRAEKVVKCKCGKRLKRSEKFYQTINPFNKNPDGSIKSKDDIYPELIKEANKWKAKGETCEQCLISDASFID